MLSKKIRQETVEAYLKETNRDLVLPGEFLDWLRPQGNHDAWKWFFAKSDEQKARDWDLSAFRSFVSGLRMKFVLEEVGPSPDRGKISRASAEYPFLYSPISGRRDGGGYVKFEASNPVHMSGLRDEALVSLRAWVKRYGALFSADDLAGIVILSDAKRDEAA